MVNNYFFQTCPYLIDHIAVTKSFSQILCLEDLKILEKWINSATIQQTTTLLLDTAYNGKTYYNRVCVKMLCYILKTFPFQRIKNLMNNFIRKSFIFIAKSQTTNRNMRQAASICCNFSEFQKQGVWLKELISSCAGSLRKTQTEPFCLKYFIKPKKHDQKSMITS